MTENSQIDPKQIYNDALKEVYRRDFKLFAKEQLNIRTATPGEIAHLQFNPIQEIVDWQFEKMMKEFGYVRLVVVKPRQPGMSTYSQARMFHRAALWKNYSVLLLALDDDNTQNIFNMARFYYDHMEEELKPMVRYSSKKELVFENPDDKTRQRFPGLGSRMNFQSSTRIQAGTGTTRHGIHISEAAKFNPNATTFLEASLMPSLHLLPGTICINEGTTYVEGDWFRACCERARSGKSEFRCIFVPWYMHPEYRLSLLSGERFRLTKEEKYIVKLAAAGQPFDQVPPFEVTLEQLKWRRLQCSSREDGENIFNQEYPTTYEGAWISYDKQVFDRLKLYEMRNSIIDPARFIRIDPGGRFFTDNNQHLSAKRDYFAVWKEPEKLHKYDIGVDTSVGIDGGDWSVAEVFDRDSHEQVAEYHVLRDGLELAEELYWIAVYYNMAQVGVEMASTGFAVNAGLQRKGYPNLYIWRHRERAYPTLSTYSGWKTQRDSKAYMVDIFRHLVNHNKLTIHSQILWNEMADFVRIPGLADYSDQFRASSGHDDAVMASGISLVIGDDESLGQVRAPRQVGIDPQEAINELLRTGGPSRIDNFEMSNKGSGVISQLRKTLKGVP